MNISISARKTTVKDSFKEKAEKKLAKFDRFFEDAATAIVTVSTERERETVEVTVKSNAMLFRAEKTTEDRLESLDAVCDLLFKQIVKNKSKLESRMRAKAFDDLGAPQEELERYDLVKRKKFPVRAMDVEEAILQMNMLGHEFFVFTNPDSGDINVVYRRKGGDYGLIEPVK